jgi:helicase associated protein
MMSEQSPYDPSVATLRAEFMKAVRVSPVTVVSAPRRVSTWSTLMNALVRARHEVVVLTANSDAKSSGARLTFTTAWTDIARELTSSSRKVLVVDRAERDGVGIQVLLGYAREQLADDPSRRLVLMGTDLDTATLTAHFGACRVLAVEDAAHVIEWRRGDDPIAETVRLVEREGRDTLLIVPKTIAMDGALRRLRKLLGDRHAVKRLSGVRPTGTARDRGAIAIVATADDLRGSAIPDVRAVVDDGRRASGVAVGDVAGRRLRLASRAECHRMAALSARNANGVYVLCSDPARRSVPPSERDVKPIHSSVSEVLLRLVQIGADVSALQCPGHAYEHALQHAKVTLERLGALRDGKVTPIGTRMARYGDLRVELARMMVAAEDLGVAHSVATIVACLVSGDPRIRASRSDAVKREEDESDLLDMLAVFQAAQDALAGTHRALSALGLDAERYGAACRARAQLQTRIASADGDAPASTGRIAPADRVKILKACLAGMVEHVGPILADGRVGTANGNRGIADTSIVDARPGELVCGRLVRRNGPKGQRSEFWMTAVSKIRPEWLTEIAEDLVSVFPSWQYDGRRNVFVRASNLLFDGKPVKTEPMAICLGEDVLRELATAVAGGHTGHPAERSNRILRERLEDVHWHTRERTPRLTADRCADLLLGRLRAFYSERLGENCEQLDAAGLDLTLKRGDVTRSTRPE